MSTTTYIFPCASTQGLTLAQKREAVKALRASIKEELAVRKMARAAAKVEKTAARQAKRNIAAAKKAGKLAAKKPKGLEKFIEE